MLKKRFWKQCQFCLCRRNCAHKTFVNIDKQKVSRSSYCSKYNIPIVIDMFVENKWLTLLYWKMNIRFYFSVCDRYVSVLQCFSCRNAFRKVTNDSQKYVRI